MQPWMHLCLRCAHQCCLGTPGWALIETSLSTLARQLRTILSEETSSPSSVVGIEVLIFFRNWDKTPHRNQLNPVPLILLSSCLKTSFFLMLPVSHNLLAFFFLTHHALKNELFSGRSYIWSLSS